MEDLGQVAKDTIVIAGTEEEEVKFRVESNVGINELLLIRVHTMLHWNSLRMMYGVP